MKTLIIILGIILMLYFTYHMMYTYGEIQYIKSDIDNQVYLIRRGNIKNIEFLKESANKLALINKNIGILIEHLNKNYPGNKDKLYFVPKLNENYNSNIISEAPIDPRYTTYTINKSDIHICLRTRDNFERLYDINILMYVMLHELAHLCNFDFQGRPILGHGLEFQYIFKCLVEEAIKLNIYSYQNYENEPEEYCGMMISTSII